MKKLLSILLVAVLALAIFAGCNNTNDGSSVSEAPSTSESEPAPSESDEPEESEAPEEDAPVTAGGIRTGIGVVSSATSSKDADGEDDGLAQADSTYVAVLLGEDDTILDVYIDTLQTKGNFDAEGKITSTTDAELPTKHELGDGYNMRPASPIGREWFEQANDFADYIRGKTLAEVMSISLDDSNHPTDEDLTASVTMAVGSYLEALEKAVANATERGASATDKLGAGLYGYIDGGHSNDADPTEGDDGRIQAYNTYAVVTVDGSGVITSCVLEASQVNINFDAEGKITTSNLEASAFKTKTELGDAYNMRPASPIGKEWYEQNEAFETYVTGKTLDEVKGIALDESNHPTEDDLTATVTMAVGDYLLALEKAVANANA